MCVLSVEACKKKRGRDPKWNGPYRFSMHCGYSFFFNSSWIAGHGDPAMCPFVMSVAFQLRCLQQAAVQSEKILGMVNSLEQRFQVEAEARKAWRGQERALRRPGAGTRASRDCL